MLVRCVDGIDMSCNVNKTVFMVFPPKEKSKTVASPFPCFGINNMELKFVDNFKYLGHIISNDERDDQDVLREVRGLFTRTDILVRKFKMCSVAVKQICLNHFARVFMAWNYGNFIRLVLLINCDSATLVV